MRRGRNRLTAALAVLAMALCLGGTATAVIRATAPSVAAVASGRFQAASQAPREGNPVRVRIPDIGVDAEIGGLGLNSDGTLEVPPYERAGWYREGPRPGEIGPAVIAAHVDTTSGPDVFYRLEELRPGAAVMVDYEDGTTVQFEVADTHSYRKAEFPAERVYGDTEGPELRLITCGGTFDRETQSYDENLVVWAAATSEPSPL